MKKKVKRRWRTVQYGFFDMYWGIYATAESGRTDQNKKARVQILEVIP